MLNSLRDLPKHLVVSGLQKLAGLEDDVTASVKEAFRAGMTRILDDLDALGYTQRKIAKDIGITDSKELSYWKSGRIPRDTDRLDRFIAYANKILPPERQIKPHDLFRDPEKELLETLARRAGYDVRKS